METTAKLIGLPESQMTPREAFLRGLRTRITRDTYRRTLDAFGGFRLGVSIDLATRTDIEAYVSHMQSPATISRVLSTLSQYYQFLVGEGVLTRDPTQAVRRPQVASFSARRGVEVHELRAMLATLDMTTMRGLRDRALLIALAVQGLRISEALGLRVADFGEEQGQRIAVVHGKGGKVARVPLAGTTVGAITDWLQGAGLHAGPVFVPVRRDGGVSLPTSALSRQAAVDIVGAIAARAGLRHIHPHLFRHGAITAALDADVPLHLVQDFARHADPRTTRRYDSHRQSLRNPTAHTLANKLVGKG